MSIKVNFAYRSLIVVSFYLMSFISFPYISRIFGVANLGLVNFVDNTVNYFLLFATMGINVLGVREIAATKSDPKLCSQVFANVLGINLLFTAITIIIYLIIVVNVPKLSQYSELFYIGSAKIVMTAFMVEWFFTGIEIHPGATIGKGLVYESLFVFANFSSLTKINRNFNILT